MLRPNCDPVTSGRRLFSRLRAAFTRVTDNWPQQGRGWAGPAGGRGLCLQTSTWAGFNLVQRLGFASDENRASAHRAASAAGRLRSDWSVL